MMVFGRNIGSRVGQILTILCIGLNACKAPEPMEKDTLVLFNFEDGFETTQIEAQDAVFEWEKDSSRIKVKSGYMTKEPGVVLKSNTNNPWKLEGYYKVEADVANVGDEFIQVEMFVGNDPDGLIRWYCSDYVDLEPGERKTISVPLAWTPWVFSPQLQVEGMRGIPGKLKTDISKIDEITINSRYAYTENNFVIDEVRAVGKLEVRDTTGFFPFVDEFGQYAHADWEGKIHSVAALKESIKRNKEQLETHPGLENRGKFGGWTKGPKLDATGFFRTEKYRDKWWIVDPEGYLFFSSGVNCVASESVYTGITGREHYFSKVPKNQGESAEFFNLGRPASHGFYKDKNRYEMFNFYQHNLYTKYGADWKSTFRNLAHERFKSWGLNTIGFVSDSGAIAQQRTPYVGSIWINGTPKIEGSNGFWGKFHDVFDPGFRTAVRRSVENQRDGAGDPWCIGYFVDNELSWGALGSLALGTLQSPASQPAKKVFVEDLKKKYGQIDRLNTVWESSYTSWDALLENTLAPDSGKAEVDLLWFYEKITDTYFKVVHEELKRVAPNQNYLGCRFAWKNNDVVLRSASKYMDIMSFNKYEYSVEDVGLPEGVDKPILISEFHFGATDRGSFHPGVKVAKDQKERGKFYKEYVEGALRNPLIVGTHWFQYLDEPFTGRFDGENYNVGLIDIYDNPHEELVNQMRDTHIGLYEYRLGHTVSNE